ncbi:hypothetical protein BC834DRAFT_644208 [Gloeopeniophorella convolvens]|nr:hypothetical protein BC834DRAFT_644208 [Gloeopeniophorella convolvens]
MYDGPFQKPLSSQIQDAPHGDTNHLPFFCGSSSFIFILDEFTCDKPAFVPKLLKPLSHSNYISTHRVVNDQVCGSRIGVLAGLPPPLAACKQCLAPRRQHPGHLRLHPVSAMGTKVCFYTLDTDSIVPGTAPRSCCPVPLHTSPCLSLNSIVPAGRCAWKLFDHEGDISAAADVSPGV